MELQPFGSDWSSSVICVVVGERASIDQPKRSVWTRIVPSAGGGIEGNKVVLSVEDEKTWTEEGDLYAVRSRTESRALQSATDRE